MRHLILSLSLSAVAISAIGQDAAAPAKPQTLEERFGYAYGREVASQLKKAGIKLDVDQFARAMRDVYADKESVLTEQEVKDAFTEAREIAEKAKTEAGKTFLVENGKKEGVKTTATGLQYLVLKEGEGPMPKATDTVKVHYRGTLVDGTQFDSSIDRGEPASFPLNRVIPGWTEGVQLMKTGSKYRFFVPFNLGYGAEGSPPDIPPYSTLIFEVELLSIGQ
jgi:FKBP-type peptidyl-prolyl cis-trans isomerase